jgi:hypothetical protein
MSPFWVALVLAARFLGGQLFVSLIKKIDPLPPNTNAG